MKLCKTLTTDNLLYYQRKRALTRRIITEAKGESWRQFCSTKGRETSLHQVWMMIKKMTGRYKPSQNPVLIKGDNQLIADVDKAY